MAKTPNKHSGLRLSGYLREAREKAGLSQGEVAKALGYTSPQFVSNWERGLSDPPIAALRVLSRLYSIPADEMFDKVLQLTIQKVTEDLKQKFGTYKAQ